MTNDRLLRACFFDDAVPVVQHAEIEVEGVKYYVGLCPACAARFRNPTTGDGYRLVYEAPRLIKEKSGSAGR